MSDQIVTNPATPPAETPKPTATTQDKTGGQTFSQEQVEQIVKERLEREKAKADKQAKEAADKAAADTAAKQGEWQKLAEQREKEAASLKAQLEAVQLAAKKRSIGAEFGLPEVLAERLTGTTDDELKADAKRLAELMPKAPKPAPGPVNPGSGGKVKETDAQVRNRIYGNPSQMFDPNYAREQGGGVFIKGKE